VFGTFDSVVGFAVVVYPYIPFDKGGGNYEYAPTAFFYGNDCRILPNDGPLVVLLDTDDYYYVTNDRSRDIRKYWGTLGENEPPPIYQIARSSFVRVEYSPIPASREGR
jgi:hypothetical protein